MQQINLSKHNLLMIVLIAVAVTGVILAAEHYLLPLLLPDPPADTADQEAAAVAVSAVQEIFTIDYLRGQDEWLTRVCANATPSGCALFSSAVDGLWEKYRLAESQVEAIAKPLGKLAENDKEQVWQLAVHLSSPLPGSNRIQDTAYVVVIKSDTGWRFDRFLLAEEVNALLSLPATSAQGGQ